MSNDDSQSEHADFSASEEDEWLPNKEIKKRKYKEDSSSDEDLEEKPKRRGRKRASIVPQLSPRRRPATRSQKTITELAFDSMFKKEIKAKNRNSRNNKFKNRKVKKDELSDSSIDTDSSVENHLIHPSKLNLNSKFFKPIATKNQEIRPKLDFDCNAGFQLSDTSEEGDFRGFKETVNHKQLIGQINQNSFANIEKIGEFSEKIEIERQKFIDYQLQHLAYEEVDDIDNLLNQGEKKLKNTKKKVSKEKPGDWEEIFHEKAPENQKPKDIEIIIADESSSRKKRKAKDIDALLKRRMNQEKRKNQIFLHKTSVACLVAHGNLLNSIINSRHLRKMAIKLLPSQVCQPKGKTNTEYFEQITKLFRQYVVLKENSNHPPLKKLPKLGFSLQLQMMKRHSICRRDFVLIFLILLRALRIHCRMVMSLPVPPKNLTQSALNPKVTKKVDQKGKNMVIPQLDGNDDVVLSSKNSKKPRMNNGISEAQFSSNVGSSKSTKIMVTNNGIVDEKVKIQTRSNGNSKVQLSSKDGSSMSNEKAPDDGRKPKIKSITKEIPSTSKLPSIKHTTKQESSKQKTEILNSKKISKKPNLKKSNKKVEMETDFIFFYKMPPKPEPQKQPVNIKSVIEESNERKRKYKFASAYSKFGDLPVPKKFINHKSRTKTKNTVQKTNLYLWVEVFSEQEEKWITIDVLSNKVHHLEHIVKQVPKPITYVFAWNKDGSIKDVSARYCRRFSTNTRKLRVEHDWLNKLLHPFRGRKSSRDILEDQKFAKINLKNPLPQSIADYKNHPQYVLKRNLRKFEAIYPPNAPPLGYTKDEPVYARECVRKIHSRELWLRLARVVKMNEKPYKIVTGRQKYNQLSGSIDGAPPLVELFGLWQTEDYVPPEAENGIVPKNAYGNVEMFKDCMLPKGTVHLKLIGLNKICRRMGIDYAPALTGFDFYGGGSHAVYDGYIVCEEFQESLIIAWNQEQIVLKAKEREKFEKRIYGNWRRLIKGLLIRKRLKNRYNFDNL